MKTKLLLSVLIAIGVSGCSSISVRRDYNAAFDFSALQTYAWQHELQPETGDPRVDNDLIDERIRRAVNDHLNRKGFKRADRDEADFLITYYREYRSRISGTSWSAGMGRGSYGSYGSIGYGSDISEYDQSILIIDMLSMADEKALWRGIGIRAVYEGSSPDKITRIVNKAVAKILKKFPPR